MGFVLGRLRSTRLQTTCITNPINMNPDSIEENLDFVFAGNGEGELSMLLFGMI